MAGRPRLTEADFDNKKMGANPFLKNLTIGVRETKTKLNIIVGRKDEEVFTQVGAEGDFVNRYLSEIQHFTKIFHSPTHRIAIGLLPSRAHTLLIWILFELKQSHDFIVINVKRYKKENKCSHNTYLRSVVDLVDANIILSTPWQTVFWINPSLMFNGSRIKVFEGNTRIFQKTDKTEVEKKSIPYTIESILK